MKATRVRKKGCPFCKESPNGCVVTATERWLYVSCLECRATGPRVDLSEHDKTAMETQDAAWSKWNKRG